MRIVFTLLTAAMIAASAVAQAAVVDVLSGDVIRIDRNDWRIANIDAPSLTSLCPDERQVAVLAQAKLAEFVGQGEMEIRPTGQRDPMTRAMAFVRINGEDVGEKMIATGLAQRHDQARPLCLAHKGDHRTDHVGIAQGQPRTHTLPPTLGSSGHGSAGRSTY
jgi:endonuclease YncB( thermonuclease family)